MPAHVGLTRAEVPGRTVLGGGAGLERREIDADHADVRAVTAVAAPRRAGTVTANLAGVAGGGAVRIGRARSPGSWLADTMSADPPPAPPPTPLARPRRPHANCTHAS